MLFRFYTAPQGGFNNLNSQLSKYNPVTGPLEFRNENVLFLRIGINFNLTKTETCVQDYHYSIIDEL